MDPEDEGMTYAETGVDIEASELATAALVSAAAADEDDSYAGILEVNGLHLGLTTDGVGTKILVAEALDRYDTIGIDCIAMNVNDLIAEGLEPVGFVDYLALEEPDDDLAEQIGVGLGTGAELANVSLMGGETAILPEVIEGVDLAGAAVGLADPDRRPPGTATVGDHLVGIPSSGIHSNGLTLARHAVTRDHDYTDPFPGEDRSIGEVLLEPTRIYASVTRIFDQFAPSACAHITGGGMRNLTRMGEHRYVIDEPLPVPEVFSFVQSCGDIADSEMYRTFNMGIGFVIAVGSDDADAVAAAVDGHVIGHVEEGTGVEIDGLELTT